MKLPLCMRGYRLICLQACFCTASAAFGAPAASIDCPKLIETKAIHITGAPSGWDAYVDAPLYLHSAAPMSGPPEQLGELAGFKQAQGKGYWTHTYPLDGKFPEGKWLVCSYGETDQVKLSRKLNDTIQSCSFTYRKGKYVGQNDITISCKP